MKKIRHHCHLLTNLISFLLEQASKLLKSFQILGVIIHEMLVNVKERTLRLNRCIVSLLVYVLVFTGTWLSVIWYLKFSFIPYWSVYYFTWNYCLYSTHEFKNLHFFYLSLFMSGKLQLYSFPLSHYDIN